MMHGPIKIRFLKTIFEKGVIILNLLAARKMFDWNVLSGVISTTVHFYVQRSGHYTASNPVITTSFYATLCGTN